jgi:WD40 repeat protein
VHDHREVLALAAAAIDFELDTTERSKLRAGLDECSLCRRQASAMRATATILSRPSDIGTPGRVRDVVIGAALRGHRPAPALRTWLVASLSILVVLGGTVFVAGNRGFGLIPTESASPSVAAPTAVAQATPSATPTPAPLSPSPIPTPQPTPGETAPAISMPPIDEGPLHAGDIAAMVTDGRIVIRTKPDTGPDSAIFKTKLYPGQRVETLEGPVEGSGYSWYRVRLGDIEGWAAGASLDGEPWLVPVRNGVIAFARAAEGGIGEAIVTVGPDGTTGETYLFANPGLGQYEDLTWSPDGTRLAFVATPSAGNGSTEIYTIEADGSNLVQITQNEVDDDSPAWSPDGTRLALRVDEVDPGASGDSNVVVTPVAEPGVNVLGPGTNPVWSPDGLLIAMTVADGGATRIWVQEPNGGGRRQVADVAVASARPSWSPDGLRLVVSSSGLSIVDVASGSLTPLTSEPGSKPIWSVDGSIAFATTGSASPGVFVINADGSDLRRVSGDPGVVSTMVWSPDGRWLLVGDDVSGSPAAIVDPADGAMTAIGLESGGSRSPAWQPRLP